MPGDARRSEEHTSELQSLRHLVCRLLLEKKKTWVGGGLVFSPGARRPIYAERSRVGPWMSGRLERIFFFNDPATTEIYPLSLPDALPIYRHAGDKNVQRDCGRRGDHSGGGADRKSTRLNSSHLGISYAVFCLKKKKQ